MKLTQTPFFGKRKFKQLLAAQEARWLEKSDSKSQAPL